MNEEGALSPLLMALEALGIKLAVPRSDRASFRRSFAVADVENLGLDPSRRSNRKCTHLLAKDRPRTDVAAVGEVVDGAPPAPFENTRPPAAAALTGLCGLCCCSARCELRAEAPLRAAMVSFSFWKRSRGEACEKEERRELSPESSNRRKMKIDANELLAEIKTLFFPSPNFLRFFFNSIHDHVRPRVLPRLGRAPRRRRLQAGAARE
jgi:hypothetical protein